MKVCSVEGCGKQHSSGGHCSMHRARLKRNGSLERKFPAVCTLDGCENRHKGRGYCQKHLQRMVRLGSVELPLKPQDCTVEGCPREHYSKGYCHLHSQRVRRGDLDLTRPEGVRKKSSLLRDEFGNKRCCMCEFWLPVDQFVKQGGCLDGLSPRCRVCHGASFHGINRADVLDLLDSCGYKCSICDCDLNDRRYEIDHDHACCDGPHGCRNCVRGILCQNCNRGLGQFKDNPDYLSSAIDYLEKFSCLKT